MLTEPELITAIHQSPWKGVFAITGGGTGAIYDLQRRGGSSATILEVTVPYAMESFVSYIKATPDKFCSAKAARDLAMTAFLRANSLSKDPHLFGIGVTCSLAKGLAKDERPGRKQHAFIAVQTLEYTFVWELNLLLRDREVQEDFIADGIIQVLSWVCNVKPWPNIDDFGPCVYIEKVFANESLQRLLNKEPTNKPLALSYVSRGRNTGQLDAQKIDLTRTKTTLPYALILPGSFNPLHDGHRGMSEYASRKYKAPVYYEISIQNVDKPALDYIELKERLAQFDPGTLLVTNCSKFVDKGQLLAPYTFFIVGVDTWNRFINPKYHNNSETERNAAIKLLEENDVEFIVFGRFDGTKFIVPYTDVPEGPWPGSELIHEIVKENDFRRDISSTELRKQTNH